MLLVLALLPVVVFGQPGAITDTEVSASDEPVVFAVNAIKEQFAQNNAESSKKLELVEIVHARTQVVAGQKLYLTLHLTGDYYCDVNVWYRSWLTGADRLIITDGPTCTQQHKASARALGGLAGGVSDRKPLPLTGDAEHASVLKALDFAACAMNDRVNSMFAATLGDTSGITYTEQVTAGMTYRFYGVPMLPTTCRNQGCANIDLTACKVNVHNGQPMTCSFTVQYQAWMPTQYSLSDVSC